MPRRSRPRALEAMNVKHAKTILVGDGGVMEESYSTPLEEAHSRGTMYSSTDSAYKDKLTPKLEYETLR